jgi:hypothetical protein
VLTFWLYYLLLSGISQQNILQFFIRDKAGADSMVVHAFFPLVGEFFGDIEIGVLSWFD